MKFKFDSNGILSDKSLLYYLNFTYPNFVYRMFRDI